MKLIKWQEEYCIGIECVDEEHRLLIDQINEAYEQLNPKSSKQQVLDILGDIYGYLAAHFMLEEQMMERSLYARGLEHKMDHQILLDHIRDITVDLKQTGRLSHSSFKATVNGWLKQHFEKHDTLLHSIEHLKSHDKVNKITLRIMAQSAKNVFFRDIDLNN